MIENRFSKIDGRKLVHEGRCWLEYSNLAHLLDDPYTREEVICLVERHYPRGPHGSRGVTALEYDLGGVVEQDERERRYRERQLTAARRDRKEIRRIVLEKETALITSEPRPDLIGDYRRRRRARVSRISPGARV